MIWFGHILRTGHEVVQLVQGHFEVKGMLRGEVVYLPAMAFCSTFSALGCSPSTTTPSMLSAMMVALDVYMRRRRKVRVMWREWWWVWVGVDALLRLSSQLH